MNLALSDEQAMLAQTFRALFAKECPAERVRAAEPRGVDDDLWALVRAQGVLDMAVPAAAGGWGAGFLDLALIAEEHGRVLAPTPLLEAQVAARLLAGVGGDPAGDLLARVLAGDDLATVALHPARDGQLALVPAGAMASAVLFADGDAVMVTTQAARPAPPTIAALPLASVPTGGARVLAQGAPAVAAFGRARDEWMLLTAAALVGLAARALELGTDYARDRTQFGVPIATFQAVAHRLADCAAAIEGARLLCCDAAWSWDERPDDAAALPAMALSYAAQVANDTVGWSLHVHGGYGFMAEYDIQLYFRRAKAWANVLADPRVLLHEVADRLYGPVGTSGAV